jgi:hypothetical protein
MSQKKRVYLGRQVWVERLEKWKVSGMSASEWCRENEICYVLFNRWKSKLNNETQTKIAGPNFVELKDQNDSNGIFLECSGVKIFLSDNFKADVLARCIKTLRDHPC